jgi:hypothetical protein
MSVQPTGVVIADPRTVPAVYRYALVGTSLVVVVVHCLEALADRPVDLLVEPPDHLQIGCDED